MLKFIHLTDTHLVGRGEALYGTDPAWRLRACVADILDAHGDAAFCLVTGDLADRGGRAVYELMLEILAPLPMPVHLLVGNHDSRADLRAVFPDAFDDGNGFVQGRIETAVGDFLMLDTLEPMRHHGVFCAQRAAWLAGALAKGGERPAYLCQHHPPFPVGIAGDDRLAILERGPFERAIAPHRHRIRHMFFGHIHRPISGSWRGLPFSTLFGTNHQTALELAPYLSIERALAEPDDTVWGSPEAPHYGVVLIDAEMVVVHQRSFLAGPARFVL
jgi:3',5'-cyclic AMP phosphodiesterase CpdA